MSTVYTGSIVIDASPDDVFAFVRVPENQLRWATFVRTTRPLGEGWHEMETMFGEVRRYRLDADPATRTADLVMETTFGRLVLPSRATPHARGSVYTFTIIRPPAFPDEDWAASCTGLDRELEALASIIGREAAAA